MTLDYWKRAKEWYDRAQHEKDEFVKFILLFIALEVGWKLKSNDDLWHIKQNIAVEKKFYQNVDQKFLKKLKLELDNNPHRDVNLDRHLLPKSDIKYWSGSLNDIHDFEGIINLIMVSRNNLFHGDKGLEEKRDLFIASSVTKLLQPLVEAIIF